jgi:hypothetical protein
MVLALDDAVEACHGAELQGRELVEHAQQLAYSKFTHYSTPEWVRIDRCGDTPRG